MFWPDMADNQARRRLSQALWQIQTMLSEAGVAGSFLIATPNTVRFNPGADYWLDVEVFETAVEPAEGCSGRRSCEQQRSSEALAEAVELYRGDLLAGFYDDWVLTWTSSACVSSTTGRCPTSPWSTRAGESSRSALVYARRLVAARTAARGRPSRRDAALSAGRTTQRSLAPVRGVLFGPRRRAGGRAGSRHHRAVRVDRRPAPGRAAALRAGGHDRPSSISPPRSRWWDGRSPAPPRSRRSRELWAAGG